MIIDDESERMQKFSRLILTYWISHAFAVLFANITRSQGCDATVDGTVI